MSAQTILDKYSVEEWHDRIERLTRRLKACDKKGVCLS